MSRVIVIRYGEIFLKGKNRDYFESLLIKNIKAALSGINYRFTRTQGRYYAEDFAPEDESEMVEKVKAENLSFLDGVRMGTFTIPGDGCIDFEPIFKVLEDAGYEGYMLVEAEQDPAKANPLEYAIRARKYIAEKTGL